MNRNPKSQAELNDKLVDRTYDAIVDPHNVSELFAAWDLYMKECAVEDPQGEQKKLNDPAIQMHFQRGMELFERLGRRRNVFDPQLYVDGIAGPAVIMDERGNVLAQNAGPKSKAGLWRTLHDIPIDEGARQRIYKSISCNPKLQAPFVFVPCFWNGSFTKTCFLCMHIDPPPDINNSDVESLFLFSSIDLAIDDSVTSAFETAYKLSQTEAEVAMLLSQGLAPNAIAEKRKVSIHTVRSQLRSVLSMTEATGIQDLVRICCNFAVHLNQMQKPLLSGVLRTSPDANTRESIFSLPDGRKLAYLDMGAADGDPALMFHSIVTGPHLAPLAVQACAKRNIRIIAPSLPGYGKSSPRSQAANLDPLSSVAKDYELLLEHLGIKQAAILGHASGVAFAQSFARDNPEIAKAFLMVRFAGHLPRTVLDDMPTTHRALGKTALNSEQALSFLARASIGLLDTGDRTEFIRLLHNPTDADWKDLSRLDIYSTMILGFEHLSAQGHQGFCTYAPITWKDWTQNGVRVKAPVTIIHGAQDMLFPYKTIKPYIDAHPQTRLVQIEDGGQFIFYTHWNEILDALQTHGQSSERQSRPSS